MPGLKVYRETPHDRIGMASFVLPGFPAGELARVLCDRFGIMTRSGHHCAEPLVRHFGQSHMVRVSLYFYNTFAEVSYIVRALGRVQRESSGAA